METPDAPGAHEEPVIPDHLRVLVSIDLSQLPPGGAWSEPVQVRATPTPYGYVIDLREPQ